MRSPRQATAVVVGLAAALLGAAAWQVVQMTECEGDGASSDRSARLDAYCDLKLHFLALLLPGVMVIAGTAVARRRGDVRAFQGAVALATLTALSPIVAAFVLR